MKRLCVLRTAAHAVLVVSLSIGYAATGSANSTGITGLSGKDGIYCHNCHAGGTAPTVAFEGPTTLELGSMATFKFTVTSQAFAQVAAGLDVAASGGMLGVVDGQGTRLEHSEVTHNEPRANDANSQAIFMFTWQAPAIAGTYTLFGAATSVNLNTFRTGDGAARTTYEIVVGATVPTPTPPLPTATATATATMVPTSSTKTCVGDCGDDGEVTVDELITGVNMALGVTPLSACPVFDAGDDGEVTIDEILRAVNNALNNCPV